MAHGFSDSEQQMLLAVTRISAHRGAHAAAGQNQTEVWLQGVIVCQIPAALSGKSKAAGLLFLYWWSKFRFMTLSPIATT